MGYPSTRTTGGDSVEGLDPAGKPKAVRLDRIVCNGSQNDLLDRRAQ